MYLQTLPKGGEKLLGWEINNHVSMTKRLKAVPPYIPPQLISH